MIRKALFLSLLLCAACGQVEDGDSSPAAEPVERGPYAVTSTNLAIAPEYTEIGDEAMHAILLGRAESGEAPRFLADVLENPESAWVVDVPIPDDEEVYGPAAGDVLPVVSYVTFPSGDDGKQRSYAVPYHDSQYGIFEDMLAPGEQPVFADPEERYPLVVLAHGASAHGLYDVRRAHVLASHGYVVVVITYGDDRTLLENTRNDHLAFLRPLLTKAVIDSLVDSEWFGGHIDADNIGISGHSFGGFTALALAGGPYLGNPATASDDRIKAGVIAAPWVGGRDEDGGLYAFGPDNQELRNVTVPFITFVGSKDDVTPASITLPATRHLSGPTYVVELVDQPHVFEPGSWADRDNWELLFLDAYLKGNTGSLEKLNSTHSMAGGNEDIQLFEYQRMTGAD